jgi:hypothetical protein
LAVFQALANGAALSGQVVKGVPLVELGGRSLSLMAGLMPETTLWQVLREVRDMPGAPVLRTRQAAGQLADRYALTTPKLDDVAITPDAIDLARVELAPVHAAWSVLGLHNRRIHDLIHAGLTAPADVFAAARVGRSAGYEALAALAAVGLITQSRGHVAPGPRTLDDIAIAHDLDSVRAQRIATHKRQRAGWRAWLAARFTPQDVADHGGESGRVDACEPWEAIDTEHYLAAVLATGPPPPDAEPAKSDDSELAANDDAALELLIIELGATIVDEQTGSSPSVTEGKPLAISAISPGWGETI